LRLRSIAGRVAVLALWLCASPRALANPLDTFGFGSRASGLAGTAAAGAVGFAAAHHNPAGVAATSDVEAAVGYGYAFTRLRLDGQDSRTTAPRGVSLGLAVPLRLGSWRIAFGLALYLPDQFLLRIHHVPAAEPNFVLLDNNLQHLVVTPVVALAPTRWLQIGGGATILANAAGNGVTFDVGIASGEQIGRGQVDTALPLRAAPVVGLRVLPLPWLRVGVAYRGAIALGLRFDVLARVDLAGLIRGNVLINLRSVNVYTPHKVVGGVAVDVAPGLTLEANLEWQDWSGYRGGVPDLRVLVDLGLSTPLLRALFPDPQFRDILVPRFGAEYRRRLTSRVDWAARLGYAYERSPVPDQIGLTSFADNDRHIWSLGGGVAIDGLGGVFPKPLGVDLALQWHELVERTTVKDPRYFPGSGFTSGGRLVLLSATVTARF
jgi:long-subunit fatty acid transport protein